MGSVCTVCCPDDVDSQANQGSRRQGKPTTYTPPSIVQPPPMTAEEKEAQRKLQAEAALARSKHFNQGGGGEKLKAKAKALEDAQKKNRENGPPPLSWRD